MSHYQHANRNANSARECHIGSSSADSFAIVNFFSQQFNTVLTVSYFKYRLWAN